MILKFNIFNWCSSSIRALCYRKPRSVGLNITVAVRKVIITIFISVNHRISNAITAHPFKLAKILSSPLMLTHIVRHIFRMARSTNFKLGMRMEDNQPRRHDLQGQGRKGHVISLTRVRKQS